MDSERYPFAGFCRHVALLSNSFFYLLFGLFFFVFSCGDLSAPCFFFISPALTYFFCNQTLPWYDFLHFERVFLDLQFCFFFPSAKHFKKTFLSVSAHQAVLLWGLSDTRHKLWLWMALWWPRSSCGAAGTQTLVEAWSFIVAHKRTRAHTNTKPHDFKLDWTSELIHAGLSDVWFDHYGELPAVLVLESCSSDTRPLTAHSARHTHSLKHRRKCKYTHNTFPSFHILVLSFLSAHIPVRGVTRTVCLISVRCLVITQIKGQGTA